GDHRDPRPPPRRPGPGQPRPGHVQARPGRVAPPHPAEEIRQSQRSAAPDRATGFEPDGHRGRRLRPGRHRLRDRAQRRYRITAEPGRVPDVYRRLVARLPRQVRPHGGEPPGGRVVARPGQVGRIEVDHVDVAYLVRPEPDAGQLAPDKVTQGPGTDPGIRKSGTADHREYRHEPRAV